MVKYAIPMENMNFFLLINHYEDSMKFIRDPIKNYIAILGKTWLDKINPKVNWKENTISFIKKKNFRISKMTIKNYK